MQRREKLLSVKELKALLCVYSDEQKVDFGDKYLVELQDGGADIVLFVWIDKAEKHAADEANRKMEIEKLEAKTSLHLNQSTLGKRLIGILKSAGIKTIYQLAQNNIEDLLSIRGFGFKSIASIEIELKKHGWYPGGHRVEQEGHNNIKKAKRK